MVVPDKPVDSHNIRYRGIAAKQRPSIMMIHLKQKRVINDGFKKEVTLEKVMNKTSII